MKQPQLILVDQNDNITGYEEKLKTHQKGLLHRAFSIFVTNNRHELLLQRRAFDKYHSGGLWANTCCSHPLKGEEIEITLHRRLKAEMGFDCLLRPLFTFIYKARFENGLTEYEFDHVFTGQYEGNPKPDQAEVAEWKWMNIKALKADLIKNPDAYSYWLKAAFDEFYERYIRIVK